MKIELTNFWIWWNAFFRQWPAAQLRPELRPSKYAMAVVVRAFMEIGGGEEGGNNLGPDVQRYRTDRLGRLGTGGPWCAAFVSYCLETAAMEMDILCPIPRSHNAKRLFTNATRVGTRLELPAIGSLALWHRGAKNALTGHIGIVYDTGPVAGEFHCIEGNRGVYRPGHPSTVATFDHRVGEPGLLGFCTLP